MLQISHTSKFVLSAIRQCKDISLAIDATSFHAHGQEAWNAH